MSDNLSPEELRALYEQIELLQSSDDPADQLAATILIQDNDLDPVDLDMNWAEEHTTPIEGESAWFKLAKWFSR